MTIPEDAERAQLLPSGRQTVLANRVHWAKTYLKQAGLLQPTRRGHFRLTERGEAALSAGLQEIDNNYLFQFPELIAFKTRNKGEDDDEDVIIAQPNLMVATKDTPDEVMRKAHQQVTEQLRADLLERVIEGSFDFFERLIVDLLVAMGFGGSVEAAGHAIGRTGDGGVDGVIWQDALGLDRVYIQAKRYAPDNKIGGCHTRIFRQLGSVQGGKARVCYDF
jgi:restriction system protein